MSSFKVGKVKSLLFSGFRVEVVEVEAQILPGISSFSIVGMPTKCVMEAKDRIRGAFYSSGFTFPSGKILVNLFPASAYKDGTHYDLPIALAILNAMNKVDCISNCLCLGELSLSGQIVESAGTLLATQYAFDNHLSLIVGLVCEKEIVLAIQVPNLFMSNTLADMVKYINSHTYSVIEPYVPIVETVACPFVNVIGQPVAKRAMLISAAGKHHMVMIGSPGVGKSMLANDMHLLLPNLTRQESMEVTSMLSLAGLLHDKKLVTRPLFRSPHCTSSMVSLIGGALPGEISLAHKGVLFLDELPEFNYLDVLRVPLEAKEITVSRARSKFIYPCDFLLIAAMNPCKCGFLLEGKCVCGKHNYMNKVSAPIMDRIDIKIYLSKPQIVNKVDNTDYQELVQKARNIQIKRYGMCNSDVSINKINSYIHCDCDIVLKDFIATKNPSLRVVNKVKKIARTIADLDESELIYRHHMQESIVFVSL